MSKLFDDDYEDELENEEGNEESSLLSKRDKIFNNDYNTGNLDFEEYTNLPQVDTFYAEANLRECYDAYEYSRSKKLEELVDEYFKNTEHGKIFINKKKIPKQSIPQVFVSIREQFTENDFTGSEIFTTIADYFGINYEVLYENIPSVYRAELVKELDEKYHILKKKGVKKLF